MPHDIELILTLTAGLTAALVFGYITHRVGLSPLVGYLIAGVAVGPFTPGFVASRGLAEQLAEIGVILLLFGVGLELHVKELLAVKRVAIPGAIAQIAVATLLGVLATQAFGWGWGPGLVFGLAISVASTVVLTRVLSDSGTLHSPAGHIAMGWLVVEDIFTVLALVLMPVLFAPDANADPKGILLSIFLACAKLGALVAFTFVVGDRVIPKLLGYVAKTRSRELFTLTVLVIALGIALGAAKLFGASMALGAFLAGLVVGRSNFSARAASEALPMRDAFAVLFFVSVGMLFDPSKLIEGIGLTMATLAIVVIGKPIAALVVVLALKHPLKTGLSVAVALAQIGEFSFIVAALGRELGVLPPEAMQALVIASIVSITINPMLYRGVARGAQWWRARTGVATAASPTTPEEDADASFASHRSVIVGYGPVGRFLARLLRDNGVSPVVIELNHETVEKLKSEGIDAVYGDASQREILERAGIASAGSVIFAADSAATEAAILAARELNGGIWVIARTAYSTETKGLEQAGANRVFSSEAEVALAMATQLLHHLGATGEQLDRERDRAHAEVFDPARRDALS